MHFKEVNILGTDVSQGTKIFKEYLVKTEGPKTPSRYKGSLTIVNVELQ